MPRGRATVVHAVSRDGMPNIIPVDAGDWIRMFLYSFPGWGKTSLIATGAERYRTLIIRSSMDLIPARALNSGAEQVICDTHEAMLEVLDYCRMTEKLEYEWIWWDCASIAQDVLLDDVWEAASINKPGRAWILDANGQATGKPNISSTGGKDRPEYWTNADRIQMWVRHMVGCRRFHFGMTAHPQEGPHPTNDEGGTLLRPWVQVKQMPEKLCGYSNMVGFLEVEPDGDEDAPRRLHFKENTRFYAKDQYDAFLPEGYLDDPTIPKIMAAVEKAKGKKLGGTKTSRGRGTTTPRRRGAAKGA